MLLLAIAFGLIGNWMNIDWFHYVGIVVGNLMGQYFLYKNPHKDQKK